MKKVQNRWDANHYLKYGDQRTRAAADLAARIQLDAPESIADLGSGPGNSTQLLRERWPEASVVGVDNSSEMIDAANREFPGEDWLLADIADWMPSQELSLIYSNAALQWLPGHDILLPRLFALVATGGAFAFQIPSSTFAAVRELIHEISRDSSWNDRMEGPRSALTMHPPSFYYDTLVAPASNLDIWETEYSHVLESKDAIVDWISSTGLRPFLDALDNAEERDSFLTRLRAGVSDAYQCRKDGRVLFPFRRTFVIAYR
ncbi:MAG: methyltransferase domain-containing protein [Planctomycetota bacterium]